MNWCAKLQNSFSRVSKVFTWQKLEIFLLKLSFSSWSVFNSDQRPHKRTSSISSISTNELIQRFQTHGLWRCPYQSTIVVITHNPIFWPWWLARMWCSVHLCYQTGTGCCFISHTHLVPCRMRPCRRWRLAALCPLFPLNFVDWEDLIERWPHESHDNLLRLTCFSPPCVTRPWALK